MKNRLFVTEDLAAGAVVKLDADERHHARVLRVRDGEEIEIFNGRDGSFNAVFESADAVRVTSPAANRELSSDVHLAMAIIQIDKFELVLQKATELGISSIVPLVTARVEVRAERYRGKDERWRKIIFEAVKQSGRARIPALDAPTPFDQVITRQGSKIIFDADRPATPGDLESPTILFIGPEGGWTEDELETGQLHGCVFRQLGPRRLRAETAAIAATALLALRHV